ncbi:3-deoxy-7-phosphoheptulonate synthase [bacterium]|nr:3-deoxy-7-phosphoheptulonate synthase [bacterium]
MQPTQDLNIIKATSLISPNELKEKLPMSVESNRTVVTSRETIKAILSGTDRRLLMVVGPCSIYDPKAALDYAQRIATLQKELPNLFLVMRGYFEKPRTTIGWKGFINDPFLNGKGDITQGLHLGRELLLQITGMGVPIATEVLDPIVPQFIADLVSWASIGARTTESQTHREMASGLSMPVGFKNSTEGNLDVAINAMQAAQHPHSFLGINPDGHIAVINTRGNSYGHIILRGGKTPNYDAHTIDSASEKMLAAGFKPSMMVDCSHGNSNKQHQKQEEVALAVVDLIKSGYTQVNGLMIESNLNEGSQKIPTDLSTLKYGVSITDACIGWDTTERVLRAINSKLAPVV